MPPGYTPGDSVQVTVVLHKFAGGACTARIRLWGTGADAVNQFHSVSFPASTSSEHAVLAIEFDDLGDDPGAYLHVGRLAEDSADTCTGVAVNVRGVHILY